MAILHRGSCVTPPRLRAHGVRVHVEDVGLAAVPVAAVPVAVAASKHFMKIFFKQEENIFNTRPRVYARIVVTVAGVEGAGQRVLVALEGVVLGAPDVVAEVGITIPVTGTRVVACRIIVCLHFKIPWDVD